MLKQEHPVAKTASSRREPVLKRVLAAVVMALVAGLAVPTETEAVADLYRDVACANSGDIESGGGDCTYTVWATGTLAGAVCGKVSVGMGWFTWGATWIIGALYCGAVGTV